MVLRPGQARRQAACRRGAGLHRRQVRREREGDRARRAGAGLCKPDQRRDRRNAQAGCQSARRAGRRECRRHSTRLCRWDRRLRRCARRHVVRRLRRAHRVCGPRCRARALAAARVRRSSTGRAAGEQRGMRNGNAWNDITHIPPFPQDGNPVHCVTQTPVSISLEEKDW